MNSKLEYIKENLDIINEMIENNRPKFEIARALGIKYDTLNKNLKLLGIEYAGNPNRKGIPHLEGRKLAEEYFNGNRNVSASTLRSKLINEGIKEEKCECCGLTEWMGKKIPLELHHKNMNHYDNRLENLQILCSNCHSLAHEYNNTKGKSEQKIDYDFFKKCISEKQAIKSEKVKKEKNKRICEVCGKELTKPNQKHYCSYECSYKASQKTPSIDTLIEKLKEFNFNKSKTGRYFGVSDVSIGKWIKKFNIQK